jgi:hypothetical protein
MKSALPPLHLVCGTGDGDQSMQYIEIKKGIATAMNGHLTAQMNLNHYSSVDDEVIRKLNGKKIHRDIWESICDALLIDVTNDLLHYERGGVRADFDISCDFKFPDYTSTILTLANSEFESKTFISFKPEWITIAKKLFPDRDLIARFYQSNNQMILFPIEKGTPKGFIAFEPNNVNDDENTTIDFSLS